VLKKLLLSQYSEQGETLLGNIRTDFQKMGLDVSGLPQKFLEDEKPIKLVFIGQYSAGKSSIIKMLTGKEVAIGAEITTGESSVYAWNGLEVVDTPGIHTGLREDHDDITYEEISHAALLIFVVTNEGFSADIGAHFQKLAIEQKRADNMVLVVNKMDRSEQGNTLEQQKIIEEDLKKVLEPYNPEDLYISFLDTNSYFESLSETDFELKQAYLEQSGYDTFVNNLNDFVKEHNVMDRLGSPLYEIEGILEKCIEEQHSIDGSLGLDEAEEILRRQIRAIHDGKLRLERTSDDIVLKYTQQISALGREMASELTESSGKETLEGSLSEKKEKVTRIAQQCEKELYQLLNNAVEQMLDKVEDIMTSQLAVMTKRELELEWKELGSCNRKQQEGDNSKAIDIMKFVGNRLGKFSTKSEGLSAVELFNGTKLGEFSGTVTHTTIKKVGSVFNIKFQPWQAVKMTQILARFGAALSIVGALLSVYDAFTKKERQKEQSKKLDKARTDIQNEFNRIAEDIGTHNLSEMGKQIQSTFGEAIKACEIDIAKIKQQRERAEKNCEQLQVLLNETQELIQEIKDKSAE
jgi:putative GTPase